MMKQYNYDILANEIERIARNAGKIILNKEELFIEEKTDATNIVTNMDIKSQKYIVEECRKLIPGCSFFAEEEGLQELSDEYTWVIDPIDGTTNYAYDFHHSCISIALLYNPMTPIPTLPNNTATTLVRITEQRMLTTCTPPKSAAALVIRRYKLLSAGWLIGLCGMFHK